MSKSAIRRAQEAISSQTRPVRVALDIGGGRGNHAAIWADADILSVVLDPSLAMLAYVPGNVHRVCGVAQMIPLATCTVDLAYFHLSIHYGDWRASLSEACRALAPLGQGRIYTLGQRHHHRSFLNRWFPSVQALDASRFPDPADIASYLERRGYDVDHCEVDEVIRTTPFEFERSVRAGYVSTLQFVNAEELDRGLAAFGREYADRDIVEYVLALDRIAWTMPAGISDPDIR